jgi:coat protein Gp5
MNALEYVDWLTLEGLRLLTNPLEVAPFFNTSYNNEFTKEFTVGETVRVPFPKQFTVTNGLGYQPQPIIDRHATITVDQPFGIHFEWDSAEQALKLPRGEEKIKRDILGPAMAKLRQEIDSRCALWAYQNTPNIVGTLGANPADFDSVHGAADQRLTELGCPSSGDRGMILSPSLARALRKSAVSYFNPASEIARQFKKGSIGEAVGFDSYQSMSLYSHTAGTWAGAVTVTTTSVSGATTLAVTCTTGDTFNQADVFNVGSVNEVNPMTLRSTGTLKQFVIALSTVGAASAATLTLVAASSAGAIIGPGSPFQNVDALPVAGAALTLFPGTTSPNGKVGVNSLAIQSDAFALVGVRLANPKAAEMSSYARDPKTGISLSFLRMFDPVQRKWINRFDVLLGFGNFYNDHCAVRVLGA